MKKENVNKQQRKRGGVSHNVHCVNTTKKLIELKHQAGLLIEKPFDEEEIKPSLETIRRYREKIVRIEHSLENNLINETEFITRDILDNICEFLWLWYRALETQMKD